MVWGKVCELTDGFLWFVCGNFDVSPQNIVYNAIREESSMSDVN